MNIIKKIRKKVFFLLNTNSKKPQKLKLLTDKTALGNLTQKLNLQISNEHFTQALISIKKIVSIDPNNPDFQIQLIQLLQKNALYPEAFSLIKKNQKHHPLYYYHFHLEEAEVLYKTKHYNKALALYKKLVKLFPLKKETLNRVKELENNIPDIHIASATGQLQKIKDQQSLIIKKKIKTQKLQNILFNQENQP